MRTSRCVFLLIMMMLAVAMRHGVLGAAQGSEQASQSTAAAPPAGNVQKGQQVYNNYGCYQCHGYEGQGSIATGPRLGPRPMMAFAAFTKYVRQPAGQMPPYTTKVASDTDLADIYAFLQSRPQPPPLASIPLLK